jgi:hypothetical protein
VALQAAAIDERVATVVATATFSDLRTVAFERAPFFASKGNIEGAFRLAEREAAFKVDEVSPLAAAEGRDYVQQTPALNREGQNSRLPG